MHTKAVSVLGFGFIIGLGLASCATGEVDRSLASRTGVKNPSHARVVAEKEKSQDCRVGEERDDDGDCMRVHQFDRPFRRGGR